MTDKIVTIEVNGVPVEAIAGQMLIEVTDRQDVYVPRFCYHEKLSVAANCRMCLVEVEKAPKPLPACATPVADGMKVFTRSANAISAQKATMEFLLINHPLDCPICDQGGECELQDMAMGFGGDVSRYVEKKRAVKDKNLGPLVSTDMTRCIHCTRCVRFGQEIAGIQELGTTGRSENMEIGTYIERSVDHELSGNIIDLCPVGALNNKPYRYSARAWEMMAKPLISPHDCSGSNLFGHVLRGKLKRVVPRENELINETWIADRDRFSYEGVYADDRLTVPMLKTEKGWSEVSWDKAITHASRFIQASIGDDGDSLGALISPTATVEEMFLFSQIARDLGSNNIDYRLRARDFRDQDADPLWPSLGMPITELENLDGVLIVASNLRREVPMIAHRVRKAAIKGASVGFVNPTTYEYHFPCSAYVETPLNILVKSLASVLAAALELTDQEAPQGLSSILDGVEITDSERKAARILIDRDKTLLILGQMALRHPFFADIRAIAAGLCQITNTTLGYLPEGANSPGAALVGALPHRELGGQASEAVGLDAQGMLASPRRSYILFGLEPEHDLADAELAREAFQNADTVVCFTPYVTDELLSYADVLLPISTFAETAGTFVNVEGKWQSFEAAAKPFGDSREGWRVLRVLGNNLNLSDFDYRSAVEVLEALMGEVGDPIIDTQYKGAFEAEIKPTEVDLSGLDVPMYSIDAVVRRGEALQETAKGQNASKVGRDY